jgi:hypothetical protein
MDAFRSPAITPSTGGTMSHALRPRSITRTPTVVQLCALVVGICVLVASCLSVSYAETRKLTFGGKAEFTPPHGFTTLTAEQIQKLLPTAAGQSEVIGDTTTGSTIAYRVIEIKLTRAQLDMFRKYMTEQYTSANPAIKWVANKLETVGGRDGIRMEFSDDRHIHHISLIAYVDDDHAAMLTLNTPLKALATLEPALRASIASFRIKP